MLITDTGSNSFLFILVHEINLKLKLCCKYHEMPFKHNTVKLGK